MFFSKNILLYYYYEKKKKIKNVMFLSNTFNAFMYDYT